MQQLEKSVSKSFVSVGVSIVDIVGYPIESIPESEGTELVQSIRMKRRTPRWWSGSKHNKY